MATPVQSVRVTFANGNALETEINGTEAEVIQYYVGNWFNIGCDGDDLQQAVKVDFKPHPRRCRCESCKTEAAGMFAADLVEVQPEMF